MRSFLAGIVSAFLLFWAVNVCYGEASDFTGYWLGTIRVMETEMEIHVEILEVEGQFEGLITIPDQYQQDLPLSELKIDYPEISFILDVGAPAAFRGSMKEGYISGTFSQAGINGLFHLVEGEKPEKRIEIQELGPLEGEREVSVETTFGNLYGSLVLPASLERYPLVIIIPGSGPTDRDGNNPLMGGKGYIYRQIAEELRNAGISSLRYDKRGVGKSSDALIREEDLRVHYLVEDVIYWVNKMRTDESFSEIILLGHSQGSLLGILAAQRVEVDGLISAAGAGRDMGELLREQFERQPEPFRTEASEIITSLQRGQTTEDVSEELKSVFRSSVQPFLLSVFRIDPSDEIGELDIPILIIQGTTDLQVSVEDAEILAAKAPEAELKIIENMNHIFRIAPLDLQENIRTYGDPDLPLADGFMSAIIDFIREL